MRKSILEILAAAALTLAAILSLAAGARANDIMVTGAYARASASPTAKAGAVYFHIVNHGAAADRLLGASAAIAGRAMMHRSETKDGMTMMSDGVKTKEKQDSVRVVDIAELMDQATV